MKHIKLLSLAVVFVMALITCAPAQADNVLTPASDSQLRPGMKPDQVTVIDFNATWCGPCRFFSPIFHKASDKFAKVNFYSVDIDEFEATSNAFNISAIPTIIIMRPDGQMQTIVGIGGELTNGISEDANDNEFEEGVYNNFCKLIMKAIVNK